MADPSTPAVAASDKNGKPTLHHLNHSQSQRILWLLCELFPSQSPPTSYTLVLHSRQTSGPQKLRSPPALQSASPLGKAPTLITPSGRIITESDAIASYLIDTYDTANNLKGDGNLEKEHDGIRDSQFSSLANSTLGTTAMIAMLFDILVKQTPWVMRWLVLPIRGGVQSMFVQPELKKICTYLNTELEGREYFLGDKLSRCDFILSWPFDMLVQKGHFDMDLKEGGKLVYPNLRAWRERCMARAGWKEGIEKGGGLGEYDLTMF